MRMISPVRSDDIDFGKRPGRPVKERVLEIENEIRANVDGGRIQFSMPLRDDEVGNRLFSSRSRSAAKRVGVSVRARSTKSGFGEITILSGK